MKWRFVFLLCLLFGSVTGSMNDSTDWPVFQHDLQHTGFSYSRMPARLREAWVYKEREGHEARIVISKGKLFVTDHYIIYALDIEDGSLVWNYELERKWMWMFASPAAINDRVHVSAPTRILCLDAGRGALLWDYGVEHIGILSAPIVVDDKLITGLGGRSYEPGLKDSWRLVCLNAQTGELVWDFYMNDTAMYSPAYYEGRIFVNDGYKNMYCLDLETGDLIWKTEGESVYTSGITLDGERIFVGDQAGIACLALETGNLIWHFDCGNGTSLTPAIGYGKVFFGTPDKIFYCLDAEKGELLWKIDIGKAVTTEPIIADKKVAFGDVGGTLHIVDVKSGEIRGTVNLGLNGIMSLALSNGKLYVGKYDGTITCLEESPFRNIIMSLVMFAVLILSILALLWYRRKNLLRSAQ
jgi:outer membrane protein assembly factor BamB